MSNKIKYSESTGQILRKIRKRAKYTQFELANRIGIAEWLYSRYEKDLDLFPKKLIDRLVMCDGLEQGMIEHLVTAVSAADIERRFSDFSVEEQALKHAEQFASIIRHIDEDLLNVKEK